MFRTTPKSVLAPLPPKRLPKSIYGTSVWVHLLLEKYQLQRRIASSRRRLHYPQSNGKIERYHRTIKSDCIRPLSPLCLEDAKRGVEKYVLEYEYDSSAQCHRLCDAAGNA